MTTPIDISPDDLETVRKILAEHVPEHEVRAFGSRVNWTARQYSDLDLAVMTEKPLDILRISDLCEAFTQSDLPFRVDVLDWADTSENFRKIIEKKYAVVHNKLEKKSEWSKARLSEIIDLIGGGTPRRNNPDYWDGNIPWLSVKDFNHDRRYVNTTEEFITELGLANSSTKLLPKGHLVISARGTVGAISQLSKPMAFNQSCYGVSAKANYTTNEFLYYLIKCHIDNFKRISHGAVFDTITRKTFEHIYVSIPSLPEQHAISHILGSLDDKIELNRRMSEALELIAQALFKSWFVDFDPVRAKMEGRWHRGESLPGLPADLWDLFPNRLKNSQLGEIPKNWNIKSLGEVIVETKGRSYKSTEIAESNVALVTLKSFNRGGGYQSQGLKPYTGPYKPEQVVEPGEVIVACTDITQNAEIIGRPAVVQPDSYYMRLIASLDIMIIRPNSHRISNEFLYLLCGTSAFTNHTYSYATGTTVLHLAKDAISSFQFVLPTQEIMFVFGKTVTNIFNRISCLEKENNVLVELHNMLLHKLVSGELRLHSFNSSCYD